MNIKVDFDNIVVKEDKNDFNVKVLMLKGEKGEAGATSWGAITGTLSNQTDLKNALDGKANQSDFNTVSGQVNTNTSNIGTINGQITDINGELDDFEDLFYGNATVNDEDTSITLDNTVEARFKKLDLKGNTTQDGTPTPSSPIPVNVVSGDNGIQVCGKNLAYMKNGTYTYDNNTGVITDNSIMTLNTSSSTGSNSYFSFSNGYTQQWAPQSAIANINDMNLTPNGGTYTVTVITNETMGSAIAIYFWSSTGRDFSKQIGSNTTTTLSISLNDNEHIKDFGIWSTSANVFTNYTIKVQLEKGSSSSTYEPYQGNTYNIDLPSGMELCKIGTYQDYIYKDSDKWYLHKEIGKVVFTGGNDETWNTSETSTSGSNRFVNQSIKDYVVKPSAESVTLSMYCNYFVSKSANQTYINQEGIDVSKAGNFHVYADSTKTYTVAQFKTWLSTHNLSVYYPLATPTTTEITDTTLISQLNALEQATSKNGETNISQVNDDLPFIIYAEAFANTFNGRMEGMDYKIDNCEVLDNKVTLITSGSTDSEYPSAKAVYDLFNSITDGDEVSY